MKSILKLEYSFDMEDLKEYLKEVECKNTVNDLNQGIIDYFENELGIPITDTDNYKKILTEIIDSCLKK